MFIFLINKKYALNEFNIEIYNDKKQKIYEGKTINNKIIFQFNNNTIYKLKVINFYYGINVTIPYYHKKCNNIYYNFNLPFIVKVNITDYYYKNMPIQQGNVILYN